MTSGSTEIIIIDSYELYYWGCFYLLAVMFSDVILILVQRLLICGPTATSKIFTLPRVVRVLIDMFIDQSELCSTLYSEVYHCVRDV